MARFWTATGPTGSALVMHARALGPTMVAAGEPSAMAAIVALHPGARHTYLSTAAPGHQAALRRYYDVSGELRMQRMRVDAAHFRPADGPIRRLRGHDANRINALYATEGGPSRYSYDAIERAIYYGIFDGTELISVAGTHIVAPNQATSSPRPPRAAAGTPVPSPRR